MWNADRRRAGLGRPKGLRYVRPVLTVSVLLSCGCRQDMHDQPKFEPLEQTTFYSDTMSARPGVEGTVARGHLNDDEQLHTGRNGKTLAVTFPFEVDAAVMARGQDRYNIFCTPCHGGTGEGDGMIVQRGYRRPPSFHDDRLRGAAPGHYFDVITNGFGAMPDYRTQISARDRWAIAAYVRALQYSRRASIDDVPSDQRQRLVGAELAPPVEGRPRSAPTPRGKDVR